MLGHPADEHRLGKSDSRDIGWFPISLTGRALELAEVDWLLESATTEAAALVIEGEAGIGKSTLLNAAVERASRRGFQVLACRGSAAEVQFEYAALTDLLADAPQPADLPVAQRFALEVATRRAVADRPVDVALVATALTAVLRGAQRPILLAVDDQPWLDASTSAALAFAIRRLSGVHIGVIVTRRTDSALELPWQFPQTVRTISPGPLTESELHELLSERLGRRLDRSHLGRVHAATGGNPLYALELARMPEGVPRSLVEVVADRLSKVGDDVRPILYAIAASARPTVSRLRVAFESPLDNELDVAEEAGVIRILDDRLEFTHPLLATVVQDQMSAPARRAVHRRLAKAELEPETRARHLALATLGASAAVAASLEDAAQEVLQHGGAVATAADLLKLAIGRTPEDEADALERRSLKLADVLFTAGDLDAAAKLFDALPPTARALSTRSVIAWFQADIPAATAFAEAALREAADDAALRGELHGRLAVYATTDAPRAREHAAAAVVALELSGQDDLLAAALCNLFLAEVLAGETPRPELLERALSIEDPNGSTDQSTVPGSWYVALGQWDAARDRFHTLLERDRQRGDLSSQPLLMTHLAELELAADNWHVAADYTEAARRAFALNGGEGWGYSARVVAHLAALRGEHDTAREAARSKPADVGWLGVLTSAAAAEGNHAEVLALTGRALDQMASTGIRESMSRRDPTLERVAALAATGAHAEAGSLLDSMLQRQQRIPRPWLDAAIIRATALLTGEIPPDNDGWTTFDRARTLLLKGQLLRRARRANAAAEAFDQAEQLFSGLGATVWAENTRSERARLGLRRPGGTELTATEQQVAALIATGSTNREVAAQLHISPKTVEAHLAKIYRKLGVHSRAELGRVFASQ